MTESLKHFKACIFQTVGLIFMKFLPSIMVCKKLSAKVTLMFCVRFPLSSHCQVNTVDHVTPM